MSKDSGWVRRELLRHQDVGGRKYESPAQLKDVAVRELVKGWLESLSQVHEALARLCSRERRYREQRGKKTDPQGASGRLT